MRSLCVGDNVIDYYVNSGEMYPGGNSLNVAVHLARLGADSAYLGNIGADEMADVIVKALKANEVVFDKCVYIENGTTKHCNYEVIDGERRFISVELGDNWSGPIELTEELMKYVNEFDVVISNCNAKMQDEMHKISDTDRIYVYDFGEKDKYHVDEYLEKVCRNMDLAMFSLPYQPVEQVAEFAKKIRDKGCANVLVTMGRHGQYLCNEKGTIHGEAKYVEAVDTMGAGDSFLAAFVCQLYKEGWKKGEILDREKVEKAFDVASDYSRDNCLSKGAFGFEVSE